MKPKLGDTRNKLIISYVDFLKWKVRREFQVYELFNNVPQWMPAYQKVKQSRPVSTFTDHDPGKAFGSPAVYGYTTLGPTRPVGFSGYSAYSGVSNSNKNNV